MIAALRDASSAYLHIYRAAEDFPVERLDAEHREILAACAARDPERAARGHARAPAARPSSTWRRACEPHPHHARRQPPAPRRPHPDDVRQAGGRAGRPGGAGERTRAAVAEVVRKQADAGVDVVSDGEMGKPSYVTYITDRLAASAARASRSSTPTWSSSRSLREKVFGDPGRRAGARRPATRPIAVRDPARRAPGHRAPHRGAPRASTWPAFMNAASPGVIALYFRDDHYGSREAYLDAIAEAMQPEYEAIVGGRPAAADRLPRPRHGPPHPVRGQDARRVPHRGAR